MANGQTPPGVGDRRARTRVVERGQQRSTVGRPRSRESLPEAAILGCEVLSMTESLAVTLSAIGEMRRCSHLPDIAWRCTVTRGDERVQPLEVWPRAQPRQDHPGIGQRALDEWLVGPQ